jgi:cysteinyl-tRNA synthetase
VGEVLFDVQSMPDYGKLSGRDLAENLAGARVEVDAHKKNPADFVLWKQSSANEPGWDSPWGRGRPGWHIECSAMSCALLGEQFDIHGGGMDLQFPHHENEIAQSEGATGKPFVKYWMHNGFLNIDNEKMSKSLGNFFVVRDVLKHYDAEVVRFLLLRSHYRSPLNYSDANLDDAKHALTRLYTALRDHPSAAGQVDWNEPHARRFKEAMDDDFGTPEAVAELHQLANKVFQGDAAAARQMRALGAVLGLLQRDANAFLRSAPAGVSEAWIAERIAARQGARKSRDFAQADHIRQELLDRGIVLEDQGSATTWRRV